MEDAAALIDRLEHALEPVEERICELLWKLATSGDDTLEEQLVANQMELHELLSNTADFHQINELLAAGRLTKTDRRIFENLYHLFLDKQESAVSAKRKAEIDASIISIFTSFRSKVAGEELSVNAIKEVLSKSTDMAHRKAVWEASKQIGPLLEDLILERVKLCNEMAEELGFRNYYLMQLRLQEISEQELFDILDQMERATREPFSRLKGELDAKLVKTFGLKNRSELRPWHYNDPFFQEAPPLTHLDLDQYYAGKDLEEMTRISFERMGMEIGELLSQSDLYERSGKDQHAFCLMIGHNPQKVRILCNCKENAYWMGVMLHEFGHGVYFQYLDPEQNYLLRGVAHISTTEAMAMLFGRLTHSEAWLREVLGLDAETARQTGELAHQELSWKMLLFTRWVLVMVHFERELYTNPYQDLNRKWWDLVEKYQQVARPQDRDMPDWATKSHISQNPVYYQNYLLGELTASQIQHYIQNRLGEEPLISQPKTGPWLEEKLFKQGALRPWNEALEHLTGEKLNPTYFLQEFIQHE